MRSYTEVITSVFKERSLTERMESILLYNQAGNLFLNSCEVNLSIHRMC